MRTKILSGLLSAFMLMFILGIPMILQAEEKVAKSVVLPCEETVLVVVDMQNDFAAKGGVFAGERPMSIVDNVKTVVEKARQAKVPIIYTQDYHKLSDWEFRVTGRKPHAIAGTWGAEILECIKPREIDYVVKKSSFSVWFSCGEEMETILSKDLRCVTNAVVVGLISDVCVYSTADGLGLRGYKLILPMDCTNTRTDYGRDLLFNQMSMLYGAQLTDSEKLQFE